MKPLTDYVKVDLAANHFPAILTVPAKQLSFPLTTEDNREIDLLEAKFDSEKGCAGLAAPQIGIGKPVIVFAAPENPDFRKWRPDFTQSMDKTIWVNPQYEGIGTEKTDDYEACFSVPNMAGLINRFNKIAYTAHLRTGEIVKGTAEGYLARLIQHEIDHINGILYINYIPQDKLLPIETYRAMRAAAMSS